MKRQHARLETFLSLTWYEVVLRFLFTFVAKTSEVLLAAGLVVSTANFLTDGSILATHPGVSIAWAWAQAIAIDSSLGVSFSYTFQGLKQEEWIRGTLYGLLTLLLAGVAGGITTIDIVSHALHLSINDAMAQMGINVTILSRLRAIAVIGFILMSRLRDLPVTALSTKTESEPLPSLAPVSGSSQEPRIQAAIQSLCSQFSAEEMAQVLNACIMTKKIVLARIAPKGISESHQPQVDQQRQSHSSEDASELVGTRAAQGESEPSRKVPVAMEPPTTMERHLRKNPEPVAGVPSKEPMLEQEKIPEPQGTQLESDGAPPQDRLEQAYQSLIAEGKKPSGRALAERAHVHRSTCVDWLRVKHQQTPEKALLLEEPERDSLSVQDESLGVVVRDLSRKALEHETASVQAEPPDTAMMKLPEMDLNQHGAPRNESPGIFPDFSLPEDTPDA